MPPRRLTVCSVETVPLRVPLARTFHGSHYRMTHRSTIVTRIRTDEGVVGEAYAGDEDAGLLEIERIIADEITPQLLGEDAFAVERCWELARPATYDILRDRRYGLVACACVDSAIWDAVGKALAQPLWRLWGGYRRRLPMIAIGGYYEEGADIAAEVVALRELGVGGMKLKVGGLDPDADAERVRLARRAGGDDFILAVDANQAWTPQEAVRFARLVEEAGPGVVRGAVPLAQRSARHAGRPLQGRGADLRRSERVHGERLRRPDRRRGGRRLQLRRIVVGWADRVEAGCRAGACP